MSELLSVAEVAQRLELSPARVRQLLRDGRLVGAAGDAVPADFLDGAAVLKALPAVITLLRDARFSDAEIIDWLYREDPTLPGSPIEALRANRSREVKRRAQAAGF